MKYDYEKISPYKNKRNAKVDTITIHCMAGNLTVESCGNVFQTRKASANLGIGTDGRLGLYVPLDYRSWATSNAKNDHRAITIEVANDGGASTGWHCSDKAMSKLIEVLTELCQIYEIKKLVWSTNKADRINHKNGCNMTVHRDYANKECPGRYLYSKMGYIANEVNKRLDSCPYTYNGLDYSIVFEPKFYAEKYKDLEKNGVITNAQLFEHFCKHGMKEKRQASKDFDVSAYAAYYSDLRDNFGSDWPEYYKHYIEHGKNENRKGI